MSINEFVQFFKFVIHFFSVPQWLRAKYVARTVAKHKGCESLPKWSTKEIILFGRWHAYTPLTLFKTIKPKSNADKNVHEMVESELLREQLHSNVVSGKTRLVSWLGGIEPQTKGVRSHAADAEVLDVEECKSDALGGGKLARLRTGKVAGGGMVYPIRSSLAPEVMWVNDICRRSQIHLQPEQIVEGRQPFLYIRMVIQLFLQLFTKKFPDFFQVCPIAVPN